jgi:glycerol kinase
MITLAIIDQGTSSSRVSLFAGDELIAFAQESIEPQYNHLGWVELSPEAIWASTLTAWRHALTKGGIAPHEVAALGISNQRETTVIWDRVTGQPIYNAIVWQDRRTEVYCKELQQRVNHDLLQHKTGLILDPYFSATKICWILDNVKGARQKAEDGRLAFGTIDTFLLWRLTDGAVHATDVTNAARTLLFNIHTLQFDPELLAMFNIPSSLLPTVKANAADFGTVSVAAWQAKIPVLAMAGDQQAAMIGQDCWQKGDAKITYGTGGFFMVHTGDAMILQQKKLLQTIAYQIDDRIAYATEGSIFAAGCMVNWMRDKMQFISHAADTARYAQSVEDNGGVYLVPAFTGLGAPYWRSDIKAAFVGIDFQTRSEHFVRAALESVAYQTRAILDELLSCCDFSIDGIKVNGGMSANYWLMQFLANQLNIRVLCYKCVEATTSGILFLLQHKLGLKYVWQREKSNATYEFIPHVDKTESDKLYAEYNAVMHKFF